MANKKDVPMLKNRVLTERILIAADPELKQLWDELKRVHRVDVAERARRLLRADLAEIKNGIG